MIRRHTLITAATAALATAPACRDVVAPTPSTLIPPTTASRWIASQAIDHSREPNYRCGGFLGTGSNTCARLAVATTTRTVGANRVTSTTFSEPVQKVDYLQEAETRSSTCWDDRFIPLTCRQARVPYLRGDAYDAAGRVVATATIPGGGWYGIGEFETPYTRMRLYSSSSDIVRVEFTTDFPSPWSLGYAAFGLRELTLSCDPTTVIRANPVACRATMSDGSGLPTPTKWHFDSTDPALPNFQLDGPEGPIWTGTMVLSGKITVSALVAGATQSKSATIAVTPRDWSKDTVAYEINEVPIQYGDPPKTESELGTNRRDPHLDASRLTQAIGGPNDGLWYFTAIPYKLTFEVTYNAAAMQHGSAFWRMQSPSGTRVDGVTYCPRSRVIADVPLVKAHEGFKMTDINSHTEVYNRYFLREVRTPAEGFVSNGDSDRPQKIADAAHAVATQMAVQITHAPATNPYQSTCRFNYDANRRLP